MGQPSYPRFQWPAASSHTLWSYGASTESWSQCDASLDISDRPVEGARAEATDRGPAAYLNGFIDNGSSSDYAHLANLRRYLDGPIVPNTTS